MRLFEELGNAAAEYRMLYKAGATCQELTEQARRCEEIAKEIERRGLTAEFEAWAYGR